jgi:dTDP-4-dehydrorhamnose 3,5-epimerase
MALKDQTIAAYLLTSKYMPDQEFSINPFDVDININWPGKDFILTEKDRLAPTLQEQLDNGKLR